MKVSEAIADHYGPMTARTYDRIAAKHFWAYGETLTAVAMEAVYGRALSADQPRRAKRVLDIGPGTGNLSVRLLEEAGDCPIELVGLDASPFMAEVAKEKIEAFPNVRFEMLYGDIRDTLRLCGPRKFDLIISSFAVHHLNGPEKQALFRDLLGMLEPGAALIIGDRMPPQGSSGHKGFDPFEDYHAVLSTRFLPLYESQAQAPRLSEVMEELKRGFDRDGDQPSSIEEHVEWMRAAGFRDVRSPFHSFGCAVVSGVRA